MIDLYLCRHGETPWSLSGQHTGSTDLSLTKKGQEQAVALRPKLSAISWGGVYTSPLKRAQETAHLAGYPNPHLTPDAREWDYGTFEGLTHDQIAAQHPTWNIFLEGAPKGESPKDIAQRGKRLLEELTSLKRGPLLLFSHGHFLRALAALWIGLDVSAGRLFTLSVASVSHLGYERGQRVIHVWNG